MVCDALVLRRVVLSCSLCLCCGRPGRGAADRRDERQGDRYRAARVLPGVTVEARADVLPSPRVTVTEAAGEYRLPALPPGNYTVTFTLSGMQTVTRQAQVQLGQDTVVDATLGVQGAHRDRQRHRDRRR